ncbi:hypothetical protein DSECCO2_493090 [anaerobic digester metagenome]
MSIAIEHTNEPRKMNSHLALISRWSSTIFLLSLRNSIKLRIETNPNPITIIFLC